MTGLTLPPERDRLINHCADMATCAVSRVLADYDQGLSDDEHRSLRGHIETVLTMNPTMCDKVDAIVNRQVPRGP